MTFDHVTAFFVVGLLFVFTPVATWGVLKGRREQTTGWWCLGGVLVGSSALWVSIFSTQVPWFLYQAVGSVLIYSGTFLKVNTLRHWLGWRVWPAGGLAVFLAVYALLAVALDQWLGRQLLERALVASHVLMYSFLAWLAWKVHALRRERAALWIVGGYVAVVLMLLLLLLSAPAGVGFIWRAGAAAMGLSIVGAMTSFANHLGYVGVLLERSQASEQQALVESARQSERRALTDAMAISQRERLLASLARKLVHELSQPLTSVVSTLRLMRRAQARERLEELDVGGLLERMDGAVEVACGVVDQIRPMARANRSDQAPVLMSQLVRQTLDILDAPQHGWQVSVEAPAGQQDWVHANRGEVIQILINFVMNAVQACKASGREPLIRVAVTVDQTQVSCCMSDNGPGFSAQALQRVGQSLYTSKDDGMGVGLWLSKEIAQRYGGQLLLDNTPAGACVTLRLPRWQGETT